ncbi:MAG: hypothetical protein QOI66_939 [Myxococcales bacterium]|jgi:hypothetical protein|nr:hypothetical protein [Myxococcales bacterium]
MKIPACPRPPSAAALSLAVLATLTFGCLKSDSRSSSRGTPPATERQKLPGEIAPGYLAVDRVATMAQASVAQPPPPLVTVDPPLLEPTQPESVVPAIESER